MDSARPGQNAPSSLRRGTFSLIHASLVCTDVVALVCAFLGFRAFTILREPTVDELLRQQTWFGWGAAAALLGVALAIVAAVRALTAGERIVCVVVAVFGVAGAIFQCVFALLATHALGG